MPQTKSAPREARPRRGLKLKEAAEYLGGLSKPTMYHLNATGQLHPNRSTRHLIYIQEDLDRFLLEGMT